MAASPLQNARRVIIIGSPGAGKSTLSARLAKRLALPLVHIDQLNWQPGWVEAPREVMLARLAAAVAGNSWLIDGNYSGSLDLRLARADAVIWLDLPTWPCLWGVINRVASHIGRTRADMTRDCPERINGDFLLYVWRFRRDGRPRLAEKLAGYQGVIIRLTSRRAVTDLLRTLDGL